MQNDTISILKINASARNSYSYSRKLTEVLVNRLCDCHTGVMTKERTLPGELPFLSEAMVEAMFLPPANRKEEQGRSLLVSDQLALELKETAILVMGVPVYNFGIPASLKAYIDLVVRKGVTFKYGPGGPQGLVSGVKAYIIITSGGTAFNSHADFVSGYLRTVLAFIGITDIHFIDATQVTLKGEEVVMRNALAAIEAAVGSQKSEEDIR